MPIIESILGSYLAKFSAVVIGGTVVFLFIDKSNDYKYTKTFAFNVFWLLNYLKLNYDTNVEPCFKNLCSKNIPHTVYFIKNGAPLHTLYSDTSLNLNTFIEPIEKYNNYEFILYKTLNCQETYDLIRYNETPETLSYTKSNVKFLASELTFKNTTFEIDKSLGDYFVKDNIIFDNSFMTWYMRQKYNVDLSSEYTVNVINSDFDVINLSSKQYIKLNKDSYDVLEYTKNNDDLDNLAENKIIEDSSNNASKTSWWPW